MKGNRKKSAIVLAALLAAVFVCMIFANSIQTGGGTIEITEGTISSNLGDIAYKLYSPVTATPDNPAPGVLLLHGYQNDHETCAAYAIELARRGAVVLAIDEYGHGATDIGLVNRGYVNHKVTVNYGEDVEGVSYLEIGGATRYKVMMNFSNLSFFDDRYSTDSDGNSISDSSAGGVTAYAYLAQFPHVEPIWGIQRESELDEFISFMDNPPVLTDEMRERIARDKEMLSGDFCRGCGYCQPCPAGIEIENCNRMYLFLRRAPYETYLTEEFNEKMKQIEKCLGCGQCRKKCPYHLDTPNLLKRNYEDFKEHWAHKEDYLGKK